MAALQKHKDKCHAEQSQEPRACIPTPSQLEADKRERFLAGFMTGVVGFIGMITVSECLDGQRKWRDELKHDWS